MLTWAIVFLVVALIAGLLGFREVAGVATEIAKILFFIFLVLFLIAFLYALVNSGTPTTQIVVP